MLARPTRLNAAGTLVALAIAAVVASAAFAGNPSGGKQYAPTLSVAWPATASTANASTPTNYVVTGCGYDSSLGGVTVVVHSPQATAFAGQLPDANGCISVANFSAQAAGSYTITASQHVKNRDVVVASTSFTLN